MEHQRANRPERSRHGFTLLEILVTVAIISILAAIAVPNFLESETRAKIARAGADLKTLETAITLYYVDWNAYPPLSPAGKQAHTYGNFLGYEGGWKDDGGGQIVLGPGGGCPTSLTTPVAYLGSPPPPDPFIGAMSLGETHLYDHGLGRRNCSYFFYNFNGAAKHKVEKWVVAPAPLRFNGAGGSVHPTDWALLSPGPDETFQVENPDDENSPWISIGILYNEFDWNGMAEGRFHLYDPTNGTDSEGDLWRTSQGSLQ